MIDEALGNASTPFDFGARHVHLERAMDPGIIYDLDTEYYVRFLCILNYTIKDIHFITQNPVQCPVQRISAGNPNYPSLSIVFCITQPKKLSIVFFISFTNVGLDFSIYRVRFIPPMGNFSSI